MFSHEVSIVFLKKTFSYEASLTLSFTFHGKNVPHQATHFYLWDYICRHTLILGNPKKKKKKDETATSATPHNIMKIIIVCMNNIYHEVQCSDHIYAYTLIFCIRNFN